MNVDQDYESECHSAHDVISLSNVEVKGWSFPSVTGYWNEAPV